MAQVSGEQCAYQRILITRADEMARKMLETDEKHFMKRFISDTK